jgi:hypothetical protein
MRTLSCYMLFFKCTESKSILGGYVFGNELIIVNGLITFGGLWVTSSRKAGEVRKSENLKIGIRPKKLND